LVARVSIRKGKLDVADAALKPLLQLAPKLASVQTEVGNLAAARGRRPDARAAFQRALAADPVNRAALVSLTAMDAIDGKADEARSRIAQAIGTAPKDPYLHLIAGRLETSQKSYDAAERHLRQAIDIDPDFLDGYLALATVYAQQNRMRDALGQFEELAKKQPRSLSINTAIGLLHEMLNEPAKAKEAYEKVVALDSSAGVASNNLAWMYAQDGGDLNVALKLAQAAKAKMPDRPEVNDTLGWIYVKKGLGSLAVQPLQQAISARPQRPAYHYHLGMAYVATGDKQKARESLEKALSLDSNFNGANEARKALADLKS
jgi:tetratricopeptide (TPR) repeat protein